MQPNRKSTYRSAFYWAFLAVSIGLAGAFFAGPVQATACYSESLMDYVNSRLPTARTDRWHRIKKALLGHEGGMELAEAEQILASRKRQRLFVEHMDEVAFAIKCISELPPPEPAPEPEQVIVGGAGKAVEPEPTPVDESESQPEPQNQQPTLTANFKVFWHGGVNGVTSSADWRISENDHWQSELIVQLELPTVQTNDSTTIFCVSGGVWDGTDYWHRGPFRMSGITSFVDEYNGQYACTNPIDSSDAVSRESITGGNRLTYRGTILTRDNNVVEKDLDVGKLVFTYGAAGNRQSYGRTNQTPTTHHVPATDMVADRAAYRFRSDNVAFPVRQCLGDGSRWDVFTTLTCGELVKAKWLDRVNYSRNTCGQSKDNDPSYTVRANVTEEEWIPDACYPTKEVLSDPLTSAEAIAHSENRLPVIEDDEVAYLNVRKRGGKWTYSNSKPIVQEEIKGRPATCSNWAQRKDYVYLEIRKGPSLYLELPAGDVWDYDMRKAKIATGCSEGAILYTNSGATLSALCVGTINRQKLSGVLLDSIWIGGWGEVKKSNNDQIVFEQAGQIVNLCQ